MVNHEHSEMNGAEMHESSSTVNEDPPTSSLLFHIDALDKRTAAFRKGIKGGMDLFKRLSRNLMEMEEDVKQLRLKAAALEERSRNTMATHMVPLSQPCVGSSGESALVSSVNSETNRNSGSTGTTNAGISRQTPFVSASNPGTSRTSETLETAAADISINRLPSSSSSNSGTYINSENNGTAVVGNGRQSSLFSPPKAKIPRLSNTFKTAGTDANSNQPPFASNNSVTNINSENNGTADASSSHQSSFVSPSKPGTSRTSLSLERAGAIFSSNQSPSATSANSGTHISSESNGTADPSSSHQSSFVSPPRPGTSRTSVSHERAGANVSSNQSPSASSTISNSEINSGKNEIASTFYRCSKLSETGSKGPLSLMAFLIDSDIDRNLDNNQTADISISGLLPTASPANQDTDTITRSTVTTESILSELNTKVVIESLETMELKSPLSPERLRDFLCRIYHIKKTHTFEEKVRDFTNDMPGLKNQLLILKRMLERKKYESPSNFSAPKLLTRLPRYIKNLEKYSE